MIINEDRQEQALTTLRHALARCEQEQVDLTDVIRHFYAWTLRQKQEQKAPVVKYVRLTEESPLPEIGAKVRIEEEQMEPHCIGDVGIVTHYCDVAWQEMPIIGVMVEGKPANMPYLEKKWDYEYYRLSELSLVVEE